MEKAKQPALNQLLHGIWSGRSHPQQSLFADCPVTATEIIEKLSAQIIPTGVILFIVDGKYTYSPASTLPLSLGVLLCFRHSRFSRNPTLLCDLLRRLRSTHN